MLGSMRGRALIAAAFLTFLAAGCGTASAPSAPAGVDELVVPTPSPDPEDFVPGVDNPWFPLPPGRTWTYSVADVAGSHRLRVAVADGPEIAGVATTARVAAEQGRTVTDWYAQDRDGNVWWFGRRGVWRAGEDGAEAGLAMPATPRVGDGYRTAYAAGVVEDHATVVSLEDDRLVVAVESPVPTPVATEVTYERDEGPVEESSTSGPYRVVRLQP